MKLLLKEIVNFLAYSIFPEIEHRLLWGALSNLENSSDGSNYVRSSIGCLRSITKRWTHLSSFDDKKMMFLTVWWENIKSSKSPIRFDLLCLFVRSQKLGVWVRSPIDEHVLVCLKFEKWYSSLSMFEKMVFDASLEYSYLYIQYNGNYFQKSFYSMDDFWISNTKWRYS